MVKGNGEAITFGNGGGFYKPLLGAFTDILARLLLQDNEVAAHFRPCVFGEHTRRQTDSGDKSAVLHQITADGFVLRAVQYALRGDESQQSALLERVQPFHEEIVMNGSCGFVSENVLALAVPTVIDHEIAKGDVAGYKVVFVLILQFPDGFKGFLADKDIALPVRVQGL